MAVRISGVVIPKDKKIDVALTYIFGVGLSVANDILKKVQVDPNVKTADLKEAEVSKLRQVIEKDMRVEGDLKRDVVANVKRLKEIKCYRGIRHAKRLTVRGQRTKTNSRTVRGNVRSTAGSGKVKSGLKT